MTCQREAETYINENNETIESGSTVEERSGYQHAILSA